MKKTSTCLVILLIFLTANAQQPILPPSIKTPADIIDDFMDQRFGMFIHWGPVTLRGTEIGWSRGNDVPVEVYDNLYKDFNPVLFNADDWVKTAKDAGMRYLTFTAKHHDGFCLWPTEFSEYNIMNSPFKRDIVGELAEACEKYEIKFCVYFTVLDWHDPHYPIAVPGANDMKATADMNKFVITMKNQLTEIVTRYKPYMLWFDGNWESPWKDEYAVDIYTYLKRLDPNVIINNRLSYYSADDHSKLSPEIIGDYATPEQTIGELNMDFPWETCMTICNQWAWKPNDNMKSLKQCIQTLARTAGGNGNLLFNVGPMLDGRIEQRQIERLKEMGDWLDNYGESIYATKGGPFAATDNYATTRKGNKIFIHTFIPSATITLPSLPGATIQKAYVLKGAAIHFHQDTKHITLHLPAQLPDANDTVIALELDIDAELIPILTQND